MYIGKSFVNGKFIDSSESIDIISPLNLKIVGKVPSLTKEGIDLAFSSAKKAFLKNVENKNIEKIIFIAKELKSNLEKLAKYIHLETGKSQKEAKLEVERSILYIEETVNQFKKIYKKKKKIENRYVTEILKPLGVVLCISPFNYPLNLSISKIIPALIIGNSVVFKPATNGSITGSIVAKIIAKANFKPGVFNFVTGKGSKIGDYLTGNNYIDAVNFTGSVEVGKKIGKNHPLKRVIMELGGNDCAYVRADANLEVAATEIIEGAFGFAGQRCTAIKRLILNKEISNKFIDIFIEKINLLGSMPPLINLKARQRSEKLFLSAIKKKKNKIYVEPKFNSNHVSPGFLKVEKEDLLWKEEQFSPILPLIIVENDKEAIKIINDTNFGLQNSIFSKDEEVSGRLAEKIESVTVNINLKSSRSPDLIPFGGIKDSGFGLQGIKESLKSMSRILVIVGKADNEKIL